MTHPASSIPAPHGPRPATITAERRGLAEKFLRDPEAQRTAAIQQLAMLAPIMAALAEQAGVSIPKGRR